jgi:hypothetical protein
MINDKNQNSVETQSTTTTTSTVTIKPTTSAPEHSRSWWARWQKEEDRRPEWERKRDEKFKQWQKDK